MLHRCRSVAAAESGNRGEVIDGVPVFRFFDHDRAWKVGSTLAERCRREQLPVTIGIWLGQQRVFHAALPGTSADNDQWVERKRRIVQHFGAPSAEIYETLAKDDVDAFLRVFALPIERYFPAGGAVPIMVGGSLVGVMVGVLAVSGLESAEDHRAALEALSTEAAGDMD